MAKSDTAGEAARPWQSYHTVYTNAKAGMDGVDKEKVQRIVYEMSKGSKYFENEERKEAFIKQKIDNMRSRCAKLTGADISHYQKVADKRILELEATRDLSRIWIHVDMDAFYAAVETLSNPSLKGKPMAVGSMSMISTANYEARKFGVRAAMPGFIARKLCPELIFVPTDFKKYNYYSDLTRKVFQKYDPNFMAASLDEAYLDATEVCKERGVIGEEVAEEIRAHVNKETGLTCSAGVAPNRLLAKVCSDINKPNGQFVLPNNRLAVMTFISSLPIRKIGGIGKVTEHVLRDAFGIKTCEDMIQKGSYICALFSSSTADFFLSVGLGLGRTDTPEVRLRKSISNERTFSATGNKTFLYRKLGDIADMLSTDMQKEGLCGRTLTLKLKTASFEVRTRAVTLPKYISSSEEILKHASKLLKAELPVSLRLIGLRVSHLNENGNGAQPDPTQKTLTNFIVSGDASKKVMDNHSSLGAVISDCYFINDDETSISIGSHDTCSSNHRDPLDCIHSSKLEDSNSTFSSDGDHMEKFQKTTSENEEKTQDGVAQLLGADYSLPVQFEGSCLDRSESETDVMGSNAASSSHQGELFSWLNGYMCSICGMELPPNFVEERQEHSDFHLAKQLQEEESGTDLRTSMLRPRIVQKDPNASQGKRKKQKLSLKEGKHVPIDLFFVKSSQNF
ncbi:DNA polymerase kappa isoform X1 [Ziziphus jujuba]|uniref:DNA polymerase kappa n=1 Tax=Ziziphus jujuba TaxID=326968 RepID=A0A6P4AS39_ZIZJJ|nr:DNA polymerase kappa isoform X1 [Ziziphus jujuba]